MTQPFLFRILYALNIEQQLANSVLIKLNRKGTLCATIEAIRLTQQACCINAFRWNWKCFY